MITIPLLIFLIGVGVIGGAVNQKIADHDTKHKAEICSGKPMSLPDVIAPK